MTEKRSYNMGFRLLHCLVEFKYLFVAYLSTKVSIYRGGSQRDE